VLSGGSGPKMALTIQVCTVCSEEFALEPDKPGFANRCPACSEPDHADPKTKRATDADERKALMEANEARRLAMRDSSAAKIANGFPGAFVFHPVPNCAGAVAKRAAFRRSEQTSASDSVYASDLGNLYNSLAAETMNAKSVSCSKVVHLLPKMRRGKETTVKL